MAAQASHHCKCLHWKNELWLSQLHRPGCSALSWSRLSVACTVLAFLFLGNSMLRELGAAASRRHCSMTLSVSLRQVGISLMCACVSVSGPEGTPYHGGCFMFDVFFP